MKILIIFIVIYVLYKILSSVRIKVVRFHGPADFRGPQNAPGGYRDVAPKPQYQKTGEAEDTVTCAACGAYLPVNSALKRVDKGVERYFCTLPCKGAGEKGALQ